jgi:hydroxyacylglutathione hydrolase
VNGVRYVYPTNIVKYCGLDEAAKFNAFHSSLRFAYCGIYREELYPFSRPMIHVVLPVGLLQCNCSIFGDEQTREAIVVDPGEEIDTIWELLGHHQLKVQAIVITHAHIDHVAGAHKLRALSGAPVYLNEHDMELLDALAAQAKWLGVDTPPRTEVDLAARDGTVLRLGNTEFHVLHTPGHTQGSLSLWIPEENKLIAGDTLFRDSIGRTDLPGGDTRQILSSIKTRLFELPDRTVVFPGHGPETTIGREKEQNPFLRNP